MMTRANLLPPGDQVQWQGLVHPTNFPLISFTGKRKQAPRGAIQLS